MVFGERKESGGDVIATLDTAFGLRPLLLPMYIVPFLLTLICGPSFPPKEAAKEDNDWDVASTVPTTPLVAPLDISSVLGPNKI